MKNPCKVCLVRAICTTVCQDLNDYAELIFTIEDNAVRTWFKYEARPNILQRYNKIREYSKVKI